MYKNGFLK